MFLKGFAVLLVLLLFLGDFVAQVNVLLILPLKAGGLLLFVGVPGLLLIFSLLLEGTQVFQFTLGVYRSLGKGRTV